MEELLERMSLAVKALEQIAEQVSERQVALAAEAEHSVERIVATVEGQREAELSERLRVAETKLAEAEGRIAELTAAAALPVAAVPSAHAGRKTVASGMGALLAKGGVAAEGIEAGRLEAGALDASLASLSIEQRLAVKAEMLRTGLLG